MISALSIRNPLEPHLREIRRHSWRSGLTVSDLAPEWWSPSELTHFCFRNCGLACPEDAVGPNDVVVFRVEPAFTALAAIGLSLLFATASFLIAKSMIPDVPEPVGEDDSDSATFAFRGITNRRQIGLPIPALYGEHRVGGIVFSEFLATQLGFGETTTSDQLRMLIAVSEGPVKSVGGATSDSGFIDVTKVFIDGNSIAAVQVGVNLQKIRLGNIDQDKIEGFADVADFEAVGASFAGLDVPNAPSPPGVGAPEDWALAPFFDMIDVADQFTIRFLMSKGLFDQDPATGGIIDNGWDWQIRYVELDGGGSPIGDHLVLPQQQIFSSTTTPFFVSTTFPFFDLTQPVTLPDSVTPGSVLLGLLIPQTPPDPPLPPLHQGSLTTTGSPSNTPAGPIEELTVMAWAQPHNNIEGNFIAHKYLSSADTGFFVRLRIDAGDATNMRLVFAMGDGTTTRFYSVNWPDVDMVDIWRLITVTYIRSDETGKRFVRLYRDAQLENEIEITDGFQPVWNTSDALLVGARTTSTVSDDNDHAHMSIDELSIFERRLIPAEIAGKYGGEDQFGNHVGSFGDANEVGILWGWHFNVATGSPAVTTGFANAVDLTASAVDVTLPDTAIVKVHQPLSGTPKRAKFRIQIAPIFTGLPLSNQANDSSESHGGIEWADIQLLLDEDFEYPATALLAAEFFASDTLSRPPTVTCIVEGLLVKVWDGASTITPNFTTEYSQNPAWVGMDILTRERFGGGNTWKLDNMVLPTFKALADYSDELVDDSRPTATNSTTLSYAAGPKEITVTVLDPLPPHWIVGLPLGISASDTGSPTDWDTVEGKGMSIKSRTFSAGVWTLILDFGETSQADPVDTAPIAGEVTLSGREVRFRFDGVFDRQRQSVWDAAIACFATARSVPIQIGRDVFIFTDRPRDPIGLVTMANMVPGTFQTGWVGISDRPNSMEIQYTDEGVSWELNMLTVDHPSVQAPATFDGFRKQRLRLHGVTRRSQALRFGVYKLNTYSLLRRTGSFTVGVDAVHWLPGDRIFVAHDVPGWGFSGRLRTVDGLTKLQVVLDREVTIEASKTYGVTVRHGMNDEIETRTITTGAGTFAAGTILDVSVAFSMITGEDDVYSFGEETRIIADFVVAEMTLNQKEMTVEVRCVEYNETIYADAFGTLANFQITSLPDPGELGLTTQSVSALTVKAQRVTNRGGGTEDRLEASWSYGPNRSQFIGGANIWVRESGLSWAAAGTVPPGASTAIVKPSSLRDDVIYEVAVQPFTKAGTSLPVSHSARSPVRWRGFPPQLPPRPGAFSLVKSSNTFAYGWRIPPTATDMRVARWECRIGSWNTGETLFSVPGDQNFVELTERSILPVTNDIGETNPEIQLRGVLDTGESGEPNRKTFDVTVRNPTAVFSEAVEDDWTQSSQAILTNLNVLTATSDRTDVIALTGTFLSGIWQSESIDTGRLRRMQVSAWYVARAIYDVTTLADMPFKLSSRDGQRFSLEGPEWTTDADIAVPTVDIEWSFSDTATPSIEFFPFRPQNAVFRSCIFRLQLKRVQANDLNVFVRRLGIRIEEGIPYHPFDIDAGDP